MSTWVKICGVTSLADAKCAGQLGVDAIGLNFVPQSRRKVSIDVARSIVSELRAGGFTTAFVGVFADQAEQEVLHIHQSVGLDGLQLHGHEQPEQLDAYLQRGLWAFKALRIGTEQDVDSAARYAGDLLLVDAKVGQELGGTGHAFDWSLIVQLARQRRLILAGGLNPHNVAEAIRQVHPHGVDTASGVESSPGVKDGERVREFLERAKLALGPVV